MLLGPLLLIVIGGLALRAQGYHAMALIAFGLIWGFFEYVSLTRSQIELTRDKVIVNAGFPLPKSYDIPLDRIVAIDFYQPSLGSMLNFGKIMIARKEQRRSVIRFVSSPAELVARVRQQIVASTPSSTDTPRESP
jgi:uncharacterized membrane protein YdbT with pleckstrin-like domain